MLDYREKKKIRKTMYSGPVLIFLGIVLAVLLKGTWGLYQKHSEALQKSDDAKSELAKLEAQKSEMEKRVAFLQTARGKEEEIRGKFMVAKEGEGVIMVVDPKPSTTTVAVPPEPSWWDRFLNFFR